MREKKMHPECPTDENYTFKLTTRKDGMFFFINVSS